MNDDECEICRKLFSIVATAALCWMCVSTVFGLRNCELCVEPNVAAWHTIVVVLSTIWIVFYAQCGNASLKTNPSGNESSRIRCRRRRKNRNRVVGIIIIIIDVESEGNGNALWNGKENLCKTEESITSWAWISHNVRMSVPVVSVVPIVELCWDACETMVMM